MSSKPVCDRPPQSPTYCRSHLIMENSDVTQEMDYFGHIQAGWFGGLPPALDWWEVETLKVTQIQSGLQR
jgi:hypothetical protein